jgi:hypothetical protein
MSPLRFTASPSPLNLVDLTFFAPNGWDEEQAKGVGFVACETLIGEEMLDCWIGGIDVKGSWEAPRDALSLSRLAEVVRRQVASIQNRLPARPWHALNTDEMPWTCLERQPEPAEDYLSQEDLFVAITPAPELMQSILSGVCFDSRRHSRCGEWFCFLKIDGSSGLGGSEFEDRDAIEEAANSLLRPSGLGAVIGGGTGLLYSYVELALTDVAKAWEALSIRLSVGNLPKRTWLLFHDSYYQSQWYGLYDDTPPPPMPDFEA